jgi:PAS domain S-box-containing protein
MNKPTYEELEKQIKELKKTEADTAVNSLLMGTGTFRRMYQDHGAVMYIVDLSSFAIVDANKAALQFYGYDLKTMLTKRIPDLNITPEEEIRLEIKRALEDKRSFYIFKHKLASGEIRDVEVYANPVLIKGKEYSFSIVHDITERTQAEEKLGKVYEDLQIANNDLATFSYTIAHDLKSPLRLMAGFANILGDDYSEELHDDAKQLIQKICDSSIKASHLIDDILYFSQSARSELTVERVYLNHIAKEVLSDLKQNEPSREVQITLEETIEADGDTALLKVVLENLLGNAWKFTSKTESPLISFGIRKIKGRKTFVVKDNGIGFSPEFAEEIFTPFTRLHSDQEFTGTGIGLATVQRIINRHGGSIWAEGEPGKGSTFYFTLGE